jgi:Flp pilus assembly protein TadG
VTGSCTGRHGDGERRTAGDRDDGSASVELAVLAPVLVVILLLVITVGRLVVARQEVDGAAADAARAASAAASVSSAIQAAAAAASSDLSGDGLLCTPLSTAVDTADFVPGGAVSVRVSCTASLAGLSLLRLPGSRTLTSSSASPVDPYRTVTP